MTEDELIEYRLRLRLKVQEWLLREHSRLPSTQPQWSATKENWARVAVASQTVHQFQEGVLMQQEWEAAVREVFAQLP